MFALVFFCLVDHLCCHMQTWYIQIYAAYIYIYTYIICLDDAGRVFGKVVEPMAGWLWKLFTSLHYGRSKLI